VLNRVIGVSVARNIENIEEVSPETKNMLLFPQMEVFEQGHVDLAISGSSLGAVSGRSKSV
jgi:hypothetical protein